MAKVIVSKNKSPTNVKKVKVPKEKKVKTPKAGAPVSAPARSSGVAPVSNNIATAPKKTNIRSTIAPTNSSSEISLVPESEKLKVNFTAQGKSGTLYSSGEVSEDHINELIGVDGQLVFEKMIRSDAQIQKVRASMVNPIKAAKWSIVPASDDPADLEVSNLIDQIIFKDLPRGFKSKLDEILSFILKGFSCFEVIHANKVHPIIGPYTGLANLAFRDQRTLEKWTFDPKTEKLLTVKQKQTGDLTVDVDLAGDTLLIFFNEKKGSDLGFPLCRPMFGAYKRKLLAEQLQIIGAEKSAIPTPILKLADGVLMDSDEVTNAKAQLAAFTGAEMAYFVIPFGWDLILNSQNTFDPAKLQVLIKACDEKIAGAVVAMFLEMGIGGNSGNQAGVEGSINFFNKGLASVADAVCDVFNNNLIPNLVELNYGPTVAVMPKLSHSGITQDAGKELMEIVTGYVKSQTITNDPQLEDHVRKVHNLPKKAMGENIENGSVTPIAGAPVVPPTNTPEPVKNETLNFADKDFKKPFALISEQGLAVENVLRENLKFITSKYINDIMKKYVQLPAGVKQKATSMVTPGGQRKFKDALRNVLTDTAAKSLLAVRNEVPAKKNIKLNNQEKFILRLTEKYGDVSEYKLNEFSKLPASAQVLIAKQVDLITKSTIDEVTNKVAFQFSSKEVKVSDPYIIQQSLEEAAQDYIEKGTLPVKGVNAASLIVNETRDNFFFEPEVLDEIHSFTFSNPDPKTVICRELAGTTFATNDAESLLFTPPLHHNAVLNGTMITTDKDKKPIEEIKIGDLVLTHSGKHCEVYDVMARFEDKHYFELELDNGKKLSLTGEHPILTSRGWVRMDEVLLTDNIICAEDIINE